MYTEYLEYIEFLQKEGLLGQEIEHLELEDTQGISGLKAIRVDVMLGSAPDEKRPATALKNNVGSNV